MKYVNAHCHLESGALPDGVAVAITNATHPSDWGQVANYTGQGGIFGTIGVHPWRVADLPADWAEQMCSLLVANRALMVGEIGLDKHHPTPDRQLEIFTTQMQMAVEFSRVVHIHCVGAWDRVLTVLSEFAPPAIVFHDFSASPEIIRALAKYNAYFSFGRAICNPLRRRAQNALRAVSENRILSESDTNSPADVVPVVAKMSEILARPLADVTETIYNNAMELLKNG